MVNDTSGERRGAVIYGSIEQLRSPTVRRCVGIHDLVPFETQLSKRR